MIITHKGVKYEIVNWDEFSSKLLYAIGFQAEAEILHEVDRMKLVDTGSLRTSFTTDVKGNTLEISSSVPYAATLEYGTFDYFSRYGLQRFPDPGYPSIPKKKELSAKERSKLPKGGQPFAMFRRVLWNQNKMAKIIDKAVKAATR